MMPFQIRSRGFETTEAIRTYVERRLTFALDQFPGVAEEVVVTLDDLNGPRGGVDKRCRVAVRRGGLPACRAEARDADLYRAIDRVAKTITRQIARALSRVRRPPRTNRRSLAWAAAW